MSIAGDRYLHREGDVISVQISGATSGDNELVAAVAGSSIRVLSLYFVSAGTVNVRFESDAAGSPLSGRLPVIASSGVVLGHNPEGWFSTVVGESLNMELTGAIQVSGGLTYILVPVNA